MGLPANEAVLQVIEEHALTNCGGFPDVFDNAELSSKGLLTSHVRAFQVQSELRATHPEERHANCHVWAICRAVAS